MDILDQFHLEINELLPNIISCSNSSWDSLTLNVSFNNDGIGYQLDSITDNILSEGLHINDDTCDAIEDTFEKILEISLQGSKKVWKSARLTISNDNKFSLDFSD